MPAYNPWIFCAWILSVTNLSTSRTLFFDPRGFTGFSSDSFKNPFRTHSRVHSWNQLESKPPFFERIWCVVFRESLPKASFSTIKVSTYWKRKFAVARTHTDARQTRCSSFGWSFSVALIARQGASQTSKKVIPLLPRAARQAFSLLCRHTSSCPGLSCIHLHSVVVFHVFQ